MESTQAMNPRIDWRDTPDCVICRQHDCTHPDQCRLELSRRLHPSNRDRDTDGRLVRDGIPT